MVLLGQVKNHRIYLYRVHVACPYRKRRGDVISGPGPDHQDIIERLPADSGSQPVNCGLTVWLAGDGDKDLMARRIDLDRELRLVEANGVIGRPSD